MNLDLLKKEFKEIFGEESTNSASCGGRLELLGNHTDHNHGLCLVGGCNLAIVSALKKNDSSFIKIHSKGISPFEVDVLDLSFKEDERFTSKALVKGVCFYLKNKGYIVNGFSCYMESDIDKGSGISSSAAFEVLIGKIISGLFNNNTIDALTLAKAGQYAENIYFGKQSGLLDQIGVSFGGVNFVDFKSTDNPIVKHIDGCFDSLHIVLINPGKDHSNLSHLYSSIPADMLEASKKMGEKYLRDVKKEDFDKVKYSPLFTDLQRSRSLHFYLENERVIKANAAIETHDIETFLDLVKESQDSSFNLLKNTMVKNEYELSPQQGVDRANSLLKKSGACRIHGGGFGGTIIAFVKPSIFPNFIHDMSTYYGKENVKEVFIRKFGATFE